MTLKDKDSTYFHIRKNKTKIKSWITDEELRKILRQTHIIHIYTQVYIVRIKKSLLCTETAISKERKLRLASDISII